MPALQSVMAAQMKTERGEREGGGTERGREGERDTLTWTVQFNKIMDKLMWQGAREQVTT